MCCQISNSFTNEDQILKQSLVVGLPIRVGHTLDAGRGVYAIRNIAHGELIHTADPVVAHPSIASLDKVLLLPSIYSLLFQSDLIFHCHSYLLSVCVCAGVLFLSERLEKISELR